jgi:hypothetical protein
MRTALLLAGAWLSAALAGAVGPPRPASPVDRFLARYDTNKDGQISRAEAPEAMRNAFGRIDANKDGRLSRAELARFEDRLARFLGDRPAGKGGRPGEVITPAAQGERQPDRLKVGDRAPDFTLPLVKGQGTVTLSSFKGKRPVVLIFASYT